MIGIAPIETSTCLPNLRASSPDVNLSGQAFCLYGHAERGSEQARAYNGNLIKHLSTTFSQRANPPRKKISSLDLVCGSIAEGLS